jgi:hypothetical protein
MALSHSPSIVTNGLVVALDAANTKSYPGSGTTWTDLSNNGYNSTLTNTPVYNTGTSFTFAGTNQYAVLSRPVQDDFTLSCWFKTTQSSGTPVGSQWWSGMGLVDAEIAGTFSDFGMTLYNATLRFGVGNPDTTISSTLTYNDNRWHYAAASRVRSTGAVAIYIDGVLVKSGTVSNTGSLTSATQIRIGCLQSNANFFAGDISSVLIYNRVLSADEINQNFNAYRGRYGI